MLCFDLCMSRPQTSHRAGPQSDNVIQTPRASKGLRMGALSDHLAACAGLDDANHATERGRRCVTCQNSDIDSDSPNADEGCPSF